MSTAHLSCLVTSAEQHEGQPDIEWWQCQVCKASFSAEATLEVVRVQWERAKGLPEEDSNSSGCRFSLLAPSN